MTSIRCASLNRSTLATISTAGQSPVGGLDEDMIVKGIIAWLLIGGLIVHAGHLSAATPGATAARDSATALLQATDTAWNKKDGRAMAALFTDDGSFRMPGMSAVAGRNKLEQLFSDSFADRPVGLRHVTHLEHVEQLDPSTALAEADVAIEQRDDKGAWKPVKEFHSVFLITRTRDGWKLRAMRSFPVDEER